MVPFLKSSTKPDIIRDSTTNVCPIAIVTAFEAISNTVASLVASTTATFAVFVVVVNVIVDTTFPNSHSLEINPHNSVMPNSEMNLSNSFLSIATVANFTHFPLN